MWQWLYKMPSRSASPAPTKQARAPVDRGGRSLALPLQVWLLVAGSSVKVLVSWLLVGGTESYTEVGCHILRLGHSLRLTESLTAIVVTLGRASWHAQGS
jgi:hypothetical protein